MITNLYDTDFNQWVELTLKQLQNKDFGSLDLENLIEEVADLSGRDKHKLASLLTRLLEHLLKVRYWTSQRDSCLRGWLVEIKNFRIQIKRLLKKSPSLKHYLEEIFIECYLDARELMLVEMTLELEQIPEEPIATLEEVLSADWFPINIEKK